VVEAAPPRCPHPRLGTLAVEGNNLLFDADDGEKSKVVPFCTADGTLWLDEGEMWLKFVLED